MESTRTSWPATATDDPRARTEKMYGPAVITVTYNNVPFDHRLKPAWGFSCLIQGVGKTILFDTGGSGSRLTANMERLGLDPGAIEIVFVSHDHADHTGGLKDILERNRNVDVFLGKRMKILDDP